MSDTDWRVDRVRIDKIQEFIKLCEKREALHKKWKPIYELNLKYTREDERIFESMRTLEKPRENK